MTTRSRSSISALRANELLNNEFRANRKKTVTEDNASFRAISLRDMRKDSVNFQIIFDVAETGVIIRNRLFDNRSKLKDELLDCDLSDDIAYLKQVFPRDFKNESTCRMVYAIAERGLMYRSQLDKAIADCLRRNEDGDKAYYLFLKEVRGS